ncbi:BQ5605_C014g07564 [Microbotryum silenes-dioicae]|uniref:BQ5605_C014g07564 protein n=1 Tax=Microbotryum silenes-dioicae TaxID=796604 RepID=A0A2X0LXY4_9BASI|nr:BQ5605_C014g07564 [Microbotryum silenes-dioicae]
MYLIYGRRAVTIVVSPLNALSNHQAANLNRKGKKAVVVSEETWKTASCTGSWTTPITRSPSF